MKLPLTILDIKAIIPHDGKALFLQQVTELEPGKMVTATCVFPEQTVEGHFPGNPMVPGVLLMEALAQAGAVCVGSLEKFKGRQLILRGIDHSRFRKKVLPGEEITLKVEILEIRSATGKGNGTAWVKGKMVCRGEISFGVIS